MSLSYGAGGIVSAPRFPHSYPETPSGRTRPAQVRTPRSINIKAHQKMSFNINGDRDLDFESLISFLELIKNLIIK